MKATVRSTGAPFGKDLRDRVRAAVRRTLADIAETLRREAAARTPVRTGRLRRSIAAEVRGTALEELRGRVATPLAYAPLVEFGARGRPARRMFGRALEASRGRIAARVRALGKEIGRTLDG